MIAFKKHAKLYGIAPVLILALISANYTQSAYAQPVNGQPANSSLPQDISEKLENQASVISKSSLEYIQSLNQRGIPVVANFSETFDGSQFRQHIEIPASGETEKQIHENALDGRIFYFGDPEKSGGEVTAFLQKYLVNDDWPDPNRKMKLVMFPYLNAAGFYAPECIADMKHFDIESWVLNCISKSDSTKVEKSDENTVVTVQISDPVLTQAREVDLEQERKQLKTGKNSPEYIEKEIESIKKMQAMVPKRIVAFTLDPKLGYAVVKREEWTAAGQRIVVVQSDQWKHYESAGIWLPEKCDISYYANSSLTEFSQKVVGEITIKLNSIIFGLQQNVSFVLDYKEPGTHVFDRTIPEALTNSAHMIHYTVAADGAVVRGKALFVQHEITKSQRYFWLCLFLIFFVLPPVVWVILKIKKNK